MSRLIPYPLLKRPAASRLLIKFFLVCGLLVVAIGVRIATNAFAPAQVVAPPAPLELSSPTALAGLEERLRRHPDDTDAYAELGMAYLQKVRATADPSLYTQAQRAFDNAIKRNPQQLDALVGQGMLALARHDFQGALVWAEKARAINPFRAQILGLMVDAQVELGQYEAAVETLQKMVDMRPDLSSYSRVSYVRELYGDVDGALEAMQTAVEAAVPNTEPWLWTQVQVGNLYFNRGDLVNAEASYQQALHVRPDYPYALAGLARVQAAQGHVEDAIATYATVVQRLPLPDLVITLGDWYTAVGKDQAAQEQYDLVKVIQQLNAGAGMDVDLELALFNANHGDKALAEQQAQAVYARRPTIHAADTLSWALYQNGKFEAAKAYSETALRLGTRDALSHPLVASSRVTRMPVE